MSLLHSDSCTKELEAKWIWFDSNTWQSYDDETNKQIENAYLEQKESVKLNQGRYFGKYKNVYCIVFNYQSNPPSFHQMNLISKDICSIKRTLAICSSAPRIQRNSYSISKRKKKKKLKKRKRSTSNHSKKRLLSSTTTHPPIMHRSLSTPHYATTPFMKSKSQNATKTSLLSNINRIKTYKHLYNAGFSKAVIDKALSIFNGKYSVNSPILSSMTEIVNELIYIITNEKEHVDDDDEEEEIEIDDDDHKELMADAEDKDPDIMINGNGIHLSSKDEDECSNEEQGYIQQQYDEKEKESPTNSSADAADAPSSNGTNGGGGNNNDIDSGHNNVEIDFKVGAWMEVNINSIWIPGKIVDVVWSTRTPTTQISVEYQDVFNKQPTIIKLSGADINRNKVRARTQTMNNNGNNGNNNKKRFCFDERRVNGSRFNRNNLNIHKFNFEYHQTNKKYDEKNAKHPSEYINRKCFKCKGSGKCMLSINNNVNKQPIVPCLRCKSTGFAQLACTKCINASGIYRKAHSLMHSKCNGRGCARCNDTGKYPLHDILCNNCKGSGVYKIKCTLCAEQRENACLNMQQNGGLNSNNGHNDNGSGSGRSYNQCMSGYRLPQLIPFVPKRKELAVHGVNVGHHFDNQLKGMHNMKRLYHATDGVGAEDIIETGVIMRGDESVYNGGIYFAESMRGAERKCRQKGYLVIADVFVGRHKDEYYVDHEMNFEYLHESGYDSIRGHWNPNGTEYVVYNWDQVWVHVVLPFDQVNFQMISG